MPLLMSTRAEELAAAAENRPAGSVQSGEALEVLDREVLVGRRFLPGTLAVLMLLVAGLMLTLVVDPTSDGDLVLFGAAVGLPLLAAGTWLGLRVVRAGRRLLAAYFMWAEADPSAVSPATIYTRLLSGRGLVRSALAAMAFLGAAFAWTTTYAELFPGDTGRPFGESSMAVFSLVAAVTFTVACWSLVAGELRSGQVHARRVIRSRH